MDIPEQVYLDAAEARARRELGDVAEDWPSGVRTYIEVTLRGGDFRAAVRSAYRAGRIAAANEILTAAEVDGLAPSEAYHRALVIAGQLGAPEESEGSDADPT